MVFLKNILEMRDTKDVYHWGRLDLMEITWYLECVRELGLCRTRKNLILIKAKFAVLAGF